MSGGVAYVLDVTGDFPKRVNTAMVGLEKLADPEEIQEVRAMIQRHAEYTGSERAKNILKLWEEMAPKFVKVMPKDYKRALEATERVKAAGLERRRSGHGRVRTKCPRPGAGWWKLMGKPTGFLEIKRELPADRSPAERVKDWQEFHDHMPVEKLQQQGARCMDCGIPFCHTGKLLSGMASGCPINNLIPEWNDLVYRGLWKEALARLHKTNNFPEFTGRVCPAPCEGSCVLGINEPPVTIKNIECRDHRPRLGRRLGYRRTAKSAHRQESGGDRLRPGRALRARRNSTRPATPSRCSNATIASADC